MRVRGESLAACMCFASDGSDLGGSHLGSSRDAAWREYRARGDDLEYVGAVVEKVSCARGEFFLPSRHTAPQAFQRRANFGAREPW